MNFELCPLLREYLPSSRTIEAAVGSSAQVGEAEVRFTEPCGHTPLRPREGLQLSNCTVRVPVRNLDSILHESGLMRIDFLSIDLEGLELDMLLGFDLGQ
jgi:FkbM family methyltransferase